MKRLFIAIKIKETDELKKIFDDIRKNLSHEKIKWVESSNFHLTLIFLGNTDEKLISGISELMDRITFKFESYILSLVSVGVFKSIKVPNAIWLGIKKIRTMDEIKADIDRAMKDLGFIVEDREFKPHLTIGRPKNISDKYNLRQIIEKYKDKKIGDQLIEEIILYESILTPVGPIYKALHRSNFRNIHT